MPLKRDAKARPDSDPPVAKDQTIASAPDPSLPPPAVVPDLETPVSAEPSPSNSSAPSASDLSGDPTLATPPLPGLGQDRLLRVLVVEDSRLNALVLTHLLVRCSCMLHCAADGREALDCLRRNAYDLVLMDIEMPEMDGVQATAAIRNGEAGPGARDVPIVAITAHTTALDRSRCIRAGMDGFVPRPFALDTLAAAIRQALASPRA